jgi:hypothetical protein
VAILSPRRFALDVRITTVTLAMVLACVSTPLVCGWMMVDSQCAITMDICYPAPSIEVSSAPLFASAPRLFSMGGACSREAILAIDDAYRTITGRLGEAPDSPPPEMLA